MHDMINNFWLLGLSYIYVTVKSARLELVIIFPLLEIIIPGFEKCVTFNFLGMVPLVE